MLTVLVFFAIAAAVTTIISAMGKCPVWVPLGCVCVWLLLKSLPMGG